MNSIRNIILDFDGTLVDTAPLIVATMKATIHKLSLPERDDAQYRATIGLRLEDVSSALWPDLSTMGPLYAQTYHHIFDEIKHQWEVRCFPGVVETLRKLKDCGLRLAVASSRTSSSLIEYAEFFGIIGLFDAIIGGNDVRNGKPAPDPVLLICRKNNWLTSETLVVGDAVFDIQMGKNAGTATCAVTYGNQNRGELSTALPDSIIESFPDLLTVIGCKRTQRQS